MPASGLVAQISRPESDLITCHESADMKRKIFEKIDFYGRLATPWRFRALRKECPRMETKQAIISFSQSEKVKSGLIWCSQCAQITDNLPAEEKRGAIQLLQSLMAMVANEAQLARQVGGNEIWLEVEKLMNTARVMVDSGVAEEATYHFTQALSQVNRIGQQSMTYLVEHGILT
jgi:hypothetical protein